MPWQTPTLKSVRTMTRDFVAGAMATAALPKQQIVTMLASAAGVGNSVLRVMTDAMSGLAHLTLRYVDWVALQLMPDTAEKEWLDRHGEIWLTNIDGTRGRKTATYAEGFASTTATPFNVVPANTQLTAFDGTLYETTETVRSDINGALTFTVRALVPGAIGNRARDDALDFVAALSGVNTPALAIDITGGTDEESDEQLRQRVLDRIQQPPMGGDKEDYIAWAERFPGVTRAWCYPLEMGIGTVTVRFMMDELRADNMGIPLPTDVIALTAYLNTVRPVAVKDFFVIAPAVYFVNFTISGLSIDTSTTRANIQASLLAMFRERALPGQTIYASWIDEAISQAVGEDHHTQTLTDFVMTSVNEMPVLGVITYV